MGAQLYFLAFISSVFITLLFTPIVGSLAIRFNAMDHPSGRKIHRKDIPLWGGMAIFAGLYGTILLLKNASPEFHALLSENGSLIARYLEGIFVASIVVTVLGAVDDLKSVSPTTKLLGQIIAAMVIMQYGLKIEGFKLPFISKYFGIPTYLVIIITVLWIVGFINSVNLIDGIDGLATGVVAVAMFIFFVITVYQMGVQNAPQVVGRLKLAAVLSLIICGCSIGFLKFNFPPAKIFLGDSGSLLLGFMAGIITITGILKTAAAVTLAVPIIIFGFPIGDALFSILRRVFRSRSFMSADKDHIHHRLLYRRGWNAMKVDLLVYSITLGLGLLAVAIAVI